MAARSTFIVRFAEAPAASYRGGSVGHVAGKRVPLQATSAAVTGRFDAYSRATLTYRAHLAAERGARLAQAAALIGRDLDPLFVYELAFNGVAVQLTRSEAALLAQVPGVERVAQERIDRLLTSHGPSWIGAPAIWNAPAGTGNQGEGVVIGIIDGGINAAHPAFAAPGPVDGHAYSNPRSGYYGLCATVAGDCNDKLIGIYDFTGEGAQDGSDTTGHGTHVASTAGGNHLQSSAAGGISGVAPHAALISYKVCIADDPDTDADEAGCGNSAQLAAIEQAVADEVDVINLSIGGGHIDPWICFGFDCDDDGSSTDSGSTPEAFLAAREAGVVVAVAAGNDGPGPHTVSFPSVAPWVLTVAASSHDRVPDNADVIAGFSGRGPGPVGGYLVPDLSAPGVSIVAAAGTGTGTATMSGTSMASPHVAGAAALLVAAHPQWNVSDVSSALVTTARPSGRLEPALAPASVFDQGAGIVALDKAVAAGLSLRVDAQDYRDANPSTGGEAATLNEPALVLDRCERTCTVSRRFTDLVGGGSWKVFASTEPGVTVTATPSQFSLAAGATQEVVFRIDAEERAGEWTFGSVRLQRLDGSGTPDAVLPMAVFADPGALPEEIVIDADADAGFVDVAFDDLVSLPAAHFAIAGYAEEFSSGEALKQDPTNDDAFDAYGGLEDGTFVRVVTVPPESGELVLRVDTDASTAQDIDLFVGRDIGGTPGTPVQSELLCASTTPADLEHCEVQVGNRGSAATYWIIVQNWRASAPDASDHASVRYSLSDADADGGALIATGPGHVAAGEPFRVRLAWEDFTLDPGDSRVATLLLGSRAERLGITGNIPVTLRRSAAPSSAAHALVPGEILPLSLAAGEAQERLYIDVPANAASMTVTLAGSGEVDVFAAHDAVASGPVIAAAPARAAAQARSSAAGASDSLVVSGAQLLPGRWYITPANAGSSVASLDLSVALTYAAARAQTLPGAYYNPSRSGTGGFLYEAGGAWAYIWYAFLQDGTPTWYLGANAAPGAQDGTWVVALDRFAWDGSAASGTRVGEAVLTLMDANSYQVSWNLDGQSGSERYHRIDGGPCPATAPRDLTGSWYAPAQSGYGYSVNVFAALESNAAYFYDHQGVGRWAFGAVAPFGADTLVLSQFTGVGPLAAYVAPTSVEVGTYERRYDTDNAGHATLDVELVAPLSGSWTTAHPIQKLTDAVGCQ